MVFRLVIITVVSLIHLAQSIVSPNGLGSDLTILINNDLLGAQSPSADSGVILLDPQSQESASAACSALGETLWSPESNTSSIQLDLNYLVYKGNSPSQQYWIAPSSKQSRTINGNGKIAQAPNAGAHLPALCTQSAPFSDMSTADTSSQWQITVHSNNEYLTGFRDRVSFRFLGIRYAPQPERFTYSTPYTGNGTNVSALTTGPECMQLNGVPTGSEDCLSLNVFTPYLPAGQTNAQKLKPVMVWIYGGAYTNGANNDPTFDGGNIASRGDVVLVSINYRLQAFGFLALNDGVTKGNYGFADAITALEWIRKNIRDFGGDPDQITVFGQSAGAAQVKALLASPKAKGLFQAAIPMSNLGGGGYGTTYSTYFTIEEDAAEFGTQLLEMTNCTNAASQVACLRALPATTLANVGNVVRYLVVDGTYLTTPELVLNKTGSLSNVHLMHGLMRDDGAAITTYIQTTNLSVSIAEDGFNPIVATNSTLFPEPDGANKTLDVFNVTSRAATDTIFRCWDQAVAYGADVHKVFASQHFYEFNRSYQTPGFNPNAPVCQPPVTPEFPNGDPSLEYFKCHSGELYYVFGNVLRMELPLRDDLDLPFSQFALDTWSSFARTFNPNPDPAYLKARGYTNTTMELEAAGQWAPVSTANNGALAMRRLQWPSEQAAFPDIEQCAALGWPLDLFV